MRRIKLVIQMLVAFIIATFAYTLLYEPHQETVRAAVQQQLSKATPAATTSAPLSGSPMGALLTGKLRITLLDVGQGDAILLEDGQRKVMVLCALTKMIKSIVWKAATMNSGIVLIIWRVRIVP